VAVSTEESTPEQPATTVAAIILTFDAPRALETCVASIAAQSRPVTRIDVTDNASRRRVDDLLTPYPNASVHRLPENTGPAGGYAAALRAFLDSGCDYAWVLDDDCRPDPDALARQLELAAPDRLVLAAVRWAETGQTVRGHGWWGALISREIVQRVGVPNEALFWWTEDTEYLQWRIPQAGFEVVWTDEPAISVSRGRPDASKPAWKYYYEARNQVFHRLYVQRDPAHTRPLPRHLKLRVRVGRAGSSVGKLTVRVFTREHTDRAKKLAMTLRGAFDGIRRHLGRTVVPDVSDRPLPPTETFEVNP
jgi:GT2 family glycosyltransferase